MTLTAAQQRARAWLPADGSWREDPRRMTMALNSLSRARPTWTEYDRENYRWRFTEAGVRMNAVLEAGK